MEVVSTLAEDLEAASAAWASDAVRIEEEISTWRI